MQVGKQKTEKAGRDWWNIILITLMVLVVTLLATQLGRDRLKTLRNPVIGGDIPQIALSIPFKNLEQLRAQRQTARDEGYLLPNDETWIRAELQTGLEILPVRLRVPSGVLPKTAPLADSEWHLDIEITDEESPNFLTLKNATPDTLNQMLFQQAAREEGLPVPSQHLVTLSINGDMQGVFALQELPDAGWLAAEIGSATPLITFDATPYLNALEAFGGDADKARQDPLAPVSAETPLHFIPRLLPDPSHEGGPVWLAHAGQALDWPPAAAAGTIAPADWLNAEQAGRLLALAQLWGASDALDYTSRYLWWDDVTERMIPIPLHATPFSSDTRPFTLAFAADDPAILSAYLASAERMADPAYLADLQQTLTPIWEENAAQLPDAQPPWEQLAANQAAMLTALNPQSPLTIRRDPSSVGSLALTLVNESNVPILLSAIDSGSAQPLALAPQWASALTLSPGATSTLTIPLGDILNHDADATFFSDGIIHLIVQLNGLQTPISLLIPAS